MTDSLTVFGTDFTGVTGIKAKGTGNGTLTYIRPQGTLNVTQNGTVDVTNYASASVNVPTGVDIPIFTSDENNNITCNKTYAECLALVGYGTIGALLRWTDGESTYEDGLENVPAASNTVSYVMLADGVPNAQLNYASDGTITIGTPSSLATLTATSNNTYTAPSGTVYNEVIVNVPGSTPNLQAKTNVAPTTSSQTITADSGYDGLSSVQINAMPSGTAGTPSATKGSVSNHAISVTPSVTNTTGYITGGTKTGTAVSVSASELVSGTLTISSSGTKDVTNYASASVVAGSVSSPTASKGTVTNHSMTVTPSVNYSEGYINGGTSSGQAVTVTASELASGNLALTANTNSTSCVGYSTVSVAVPIVTYYTSSSAPTSSQGSNGDIWLVTS